MILIVFILGIVAGASIATWYWRAMLRDERTFWKRINTIWIEFARDSVERAK